MMIDEELLSAYLDGELEGDSLAEVEAALAQDVELQDQLAALMDADQAARAEFAAMLDEPVPDALLAALAPPAAETVAPVAPPAANLPTPPKAPAWAIAAALAGALLIGGAGGLYLGRETGVAAPPQVAEVAPWIADIADYHAVYSQQVRHLVEVPAEEADHIETWLSATLDTQVVIPDLTEQGLTFEGARLLVAAGKPVAQLLYTDADGAVVALCQIQTDNPQVAARADEVGGFELISWGAAAGNFVIVADTGREDLRDIVAAASDQV